MNYQGDIISILKEHHLRLTGTRRALFELFLKDETPLSVSDILSTLGKVHIKVNKTTVYRELKCLQKKGIIGVVQLGDRKQYYELLARGHHHHLVCLQCERVEEIDMDEAELFAGEQKVSRERGFTILRHSLEFFGICEKCQLSI
jgi:Fur family ferric uptake transcriptional regulator